MIGALVRVSEHATSAEAVRWWSGAIINLSCPSEDAADSARRVRDVCSEGVLGALVRVAANATTPTAIEEWAKVVWIVGRQGTDATDGARCRMIIEGAGVREALGKVRAQGAAEGGAAGEWVRRATEAVG